MVCTAPSPSEPPPEAFRLRGAAETHTVRRAAPAPRFRRDHSAHPSRASQRRPFARPASARRRGVRSARRAIVRPSAGLAAGRNPAADSGAMAVPMSANLFAALDTKKKKKSKVRGLPTRMNDSCAERRPRVLRRFPVGGLSRTPGLRFSKKIGRSRYRASASL